MTFLIAALSLGFLGSFHCIGMCGPIALAAHSATAGGLNPAIRGLLYNTGRIITYAAFGLLFGLVGKSFVVAGYQQALSIALGLIVLVAVLMPGKYLQRFNALTPAFKITGNIRNIFAGVLKGKTYKAALLLGLLNGLLPCGLVYLGVAGAIATGGAGNGALFMAAFGAGTFPAMMLVSVSSGFLSIKARNVIRKAVPVFVVISACMLILRGMNLGIPYISPQFSSTNCTEHSCCHKNK